MIKVEEKQFKIKIDEECINVLPTEIISKIIEINKGLPGVRGQDGKDGIDGKDGAKGQDGTNATINGYSTISIEAGNNISIKQEGDTLVISASGGEQVQSDLGQEDETAVDFVKGKRAKNIWFYYTDEESGEEYPVMNLNDLLWYMLNDLIYSLQDEISYKQDIINEQLITLEKINWYKIGNDYTYKCIIENMKSNSLVWYSPVWSDMEEWANNDIYLADITYGSITFYAKDIPEDDIQVVVRWS